MCIGAQNSGTTSLVRYMNQNPDICMFGEQHFFDRSLHLGDLTQNDIHMYENALAADAPIVGETCASYCYLRYCIDRIHEYNPNIKLVLILREPISRAFSQYTMHLHKNGRTLDDVTDGEILEHFENEALMSLKDIESNTKRYHVAEGYYDEILAYILSKFKRENVFIAISEEIRADEQAYYNQIMRFVGSDKEVQIKEADVHCGEYARTIPITVSRRLHEIYRSHNEGLYRLLGRHVPCWERYYKEISRRHNVSEGAQRNQVIIFGDSHARSFKQIVFPNQEICVRAICGGSIRGLGKHMSHLQIAQIIHRTVIECRDTLAALVLKFGQVDIEHVFLYKKYIQKQSTIVFDLFVQSVIESYFAFLEQLLLNTKAILHPSSVWIWGVNPPTPIDARAAANDILASIAKDKHDQFLYLLEDASFLNQFHYPNRLKRARSLNARLQGLASRLQLRYNEVFDELLDDRGVIHARLQGRNFHIKGVTTKELQEPANAEVKYAFQSKLFASLGFKIFCIGYNKCATTAIHKMFQSAGFRSTHNPKKWKLNEFDVFSDTASVPFVGYIASEHAVVHGSRYRDSKKMRTNFTIVSELFRLYPAAVFVLNTRPLKSWIVSRYMHGLNHDGGRDSWAWPPTEALTRKWVEDRQDYYTKIDKLFAKAPERLFVADITKAGWQAELCKFCHIEFKGCNIDMGSHNVSSTSPTKARIVQEVDTHLATISLQ